MTFFVSVELTKRSELLWHDTGDAADARLSKSTVSGTTAMQVIAPFAWVSHTRDELRRLFFGAVDEATRHSRHALDVDTGKRQAASGRMSALFRNTRWMLSIPTEALVRSEMLNLAAAIRVPLTALRPI